MRFQMQWAEDRGAARLVIITQTSEDNQEESRLKSTGTQGLFLNYHHPFFQTQMAVQK